MTFKYCSFSPKKLGNCCCCWNPSLAILRLKKNLWPLSSRGLRPGKNDCFFGVFPYIVRLYSIIPSIFTLCSEFIVNRVADQDLETALLSKNLNVNVQNSRNTLQLLYLQNIYAFLKINFSVTSPASYIDIVFIIKFIQLTNVFIHSFIIIICIKEKQTKQRNAVIIFIFFNNLIEESKNKYI